MITVVVDTSIVVSAAFRDRAPEQVISFIVGHDEFEWIVSPSILAEYNDILARRKFSLPLEILNDWREIFAQSTTIIDVDIEIDFPRDQKDARFLECALAAEADYLITGDRDFEDAEKLYETTIVSVSTFKQLIMEKWV